MFTDSAKPGIFTARQVILYLIKNAKKSERENFQDLPSGYGIHWPAIDEDLSIDGLLGIKYEFQFHERKAAS